MDSLHAPWRIEYILSPKPELKEGLFTRIAQSSDDEENLIVVRDRTCFALLNRYPYNGGHLMVVPYKEVPDMNGLTDEELADLWKLMRRCINALTAVMKPDGFNVGINLGKVAGAGIAEHLHPHRAALERRHEFHAGHREHRRRAGCAARNRGEAAGGTGKIVFAADGQCFLVFILPRCKLTADSYKPLEFRLPMSPAE